MEPDLPEAEGEEGMHLDLVVTVYVRIVVRRYHTQEGNRVLKPNVLNAGI